jgi:hypothetical protein
LSAVRVRVGQFEQSRGPYYYCIPYSIAHAQRAIYFICIEIFFILYC